ncbi:MAG: beta-ketoacyl synthase N-terminal-like domain-containing protein [Vicinamibacterales bacterium]
MSQSPGLTGSEIAVVGMSGRFPGAPTLDAFWRNLTAGTESVRRFTIDELLGAGESPDLVADPDYVPAQPVLEDVDLFDAGFFGLSPQDAAITDPQHRVFLEVGWEALEDAGYDPARFGGQVGVFATCGMNSYMMRHLVPNERIMRTVGEWLVRHTGNDMSFLATSLSYHLNLRGPSFNVQCACSSALVAIHLAVQSLLSGECDMALAGGAVVILPRDRGYLHQTGEILARDGHCRPFDAGATGTLFGSGAGVVVLRRLTDALAAGDRVIAVVKGSAVNNDGSMKVGFLAPSVEGQSRVITEALSLSGVDADSIGYVEAHGTGTIVGDPIEVAALTDAFRRDTARRQYCRIGSLKSNIGHLGEAAGVAAFIKTVLSLRHGRIPPSVNYTTPNPQIDFAASPFVVNDTLTEWPRGTTPRRAGVTALGAGGTNCHVVLEEAPATDDARPDDGRPRVLVLAARTPAALAAMRERLADALEAPGAPPLADVAHTLQVGRAQFAHRWSAACATPADAVQALRAGGATAQPASDAPVRVAFLFPGGGAQYPNMGRGLYEREPVFRAEVDRCLTVLRTRDGIDLRPVLFPADDAVEAAAQLARPMPSILAVFVVEYALARLWMSWGIEPAAMSGHSLGEYVAACLAGVFTVEDALAIVKARGDVFDRLPPGAMLGILRPESEVRAWLTGGLALAAVNAPTSCVVSGPVDEVAALEARLTADEVETQRLHIDVAAHSPMLDPFLDGFSRRIATIPMAAPTRPFISNVTGRWITPEEATSPAYWVRHLRQTVRFADGLATLLAEPDRVLLEVGPGRTLTSLARQQPTPPPGLVTSLRHPTETAGDLETCLGALGRLWSLGVAVDWDAVAGDAPRRRTALPTYPFERQRYWIDAPGGAAGAARTSPEGPPAAATATEARGGTEKRSDIADWFYAPVWTAVPPLAEPDAPDAEATAHVVVFADAVGLAAEAAARLQAARPGRTWIVEAGTSYTQVGETRFTIDPRNADDYVRVLEAIGDVAGDITHVVHGWNLPAPSMAAEEMEAELDAAFFGPLALAQAIGRQELDQPLSVVFLTSGVAQVAGEASVAPVRAALLGPSRVWAREMPNVVTRVVDVARPASAGDTDRLARLVARELADARPEPFVALRGESRWVERFAPRRLEATGPSALRESGTYLITGGLGAIGLALAAQLSARVRAHVVLIGRSPMPAREDWDRWLGQHDADDTTSRRIRAIRDAESAGGRVDVLTADVADPRQLADVRRRVLEVSPAIHGIFHAAGTLDDAPLMTKTRDAALAVLRPKVHGALALVRAFEPDAPDFIALFSSVSAVLGLQGQVDYTAANAVLDACADAAGDRRVVAIGWGPWAEAGLAVTAAHRRRSPTSETGHPWLPAIRRRPGGGGVAPLALNRDAQWMLGEHVVRGADAVMPGTGYLELARAALTALEPGTTVELAELVFQAPIIVAAGETKTVDLTVTPVGDGYECRWESGDDLFATGLARHTDAPAPEPIDLDAIGARCVARDDRPGGFLPQPFMAFGPRWANIQRVRFGEDEALVELALPEAFAGDLAWCGLHPALLDMATGGAQALIPGFDQSRHFYVPIAYERARLFARLPARVWSHVRLRRHGADLATFDVTIADETGAVLVAIDGFGMKRVDTTASLARSTSAGTASRDVRLSPAAAVAEDLLRSGMRVDEGLDALARVLAVPTGPRVLVSPGDLLAWRARIDREFSRPATPAGSRPGRRAAGGHATIEETVADLWRELLGTDEVRVTDDFFELGGHSLIAVRLLNRLEKRFGTRLTLPTLFEARTVASLSARLRERAAGTAAPGREAAADATDSGESREPALVAISRDRLRASHRRPPSSGGTR